MTTAQKDILNTFSSKFNDTVLHIIFTQESLWLSKKDICILLSIKESRLNYELMKMFSSGVFSRKNNRKRFLL
jgi:prophage antirepressor-like protein